MTRTMTSRGLSIVGLCGVALAALGACSDDAPAGPNPPRLWLALDGGETQVKLIPVQPPIF